MMVESHTDTSSTTDTVQITYIDSLGNEKTVNAPIGKNLLDIAHDNNIELEGACGGELACATCHLIFEKHIYDILPEKEPEEDDMLDLAMELTDTSRLGCQIKVTKEMDQMKVRIPDDGY
jgi:ferredoxin-2, mitochondrial